MHDFYYKILAQIVNPWTVFLLIIFLFLRKELNLFLNAIINKTNRLDRLNLKVGNFSISIESIEKFKKDLTKIEYHQAKEIYHKIELDEFTLLKKFFDNIKEYEIVLFLHLFQEAEKVVVEENTFHDLFLKKMRELSLVVQVDKYSLTSQDNREISYITWELTHIGKFILRYFMKNYNYGAEQIAPADRQSAALLGGS